MGGFLQVSGMKYTINTAVESTVKTDDKAPSSPWKARAACRTFRS